MTTVPTELQIDVARGILQLVSRRRLPAGSHLRAQALADELGVSRAPVRGALVYLAEQGLLEHRKRRGFFVRRPGTDVDADVIDLPQTADESLCVRIAKDWFEKRVPQTFSEAEFRRRYGLGRLAASRILLRLSEQGVISRSKGQGWQFEPTLNTRAAHDESYAFRMAVEPAAILSPAFELDRELAEAARRRHDSVLDVEPDDSTLTSLFDIDAEFHRLVGVSSRNRFFQAAIERQNALRRLVEYESLLDRGRLADSCREHMRILDALEAGDREQAAERMREHLRLASRFAPEYEDPPPTAT